MHLHLVWCCLSLLFVPYLEPLSRWSEICQRMEPSLPTEPNLPTDGADKANGAHGAKLADLGKQLLFRLVLQYLFFGSPLTVLLYCTHHSSIHSVMPSAQGNEDSCQFDCHCIISIPFKCLRSSILDQPRGGPRKQ
jgi:hypothetical protein